VHQPTFGPDQNGILAFIKTRTTDAVAEKGLYAGSVEFSGVTRSGHGLENGKWFIP